MSDFIECDILIYRDGILEGRIGSGVTSVIKLYNHVMDGEVKDILTINKSFGFNMDFTIKGENLIEFICNCYDEWTVNMVCGNLKPESINSITCIDLS